MLLEDVRPGMRVRVLHTAEGTRYSGRKGTVADVLPWKAVWVKFSDGYVSPFNAADLDLLRPEQTGRP